MRDLNLLIELQNYDYKLKEIRDELKEIEEDSKTEEIKNEKSILTKRKEELDIENSKIQEKLDKSDRALKDRYFNIEDIDTKLYNGSITDIHQLDHMNEELINLRKDTLKLENDTLIVMEKQEILGDELKIVEDRLSELDLNEVEIKELRSEQINKYTVDIDQYSRERLAILNQLDEGILSEYTNISSSKRDFLAEVEGEKCTGCNMMLSIFLVNKVKAETFVKCENCNRILYKK